MHPVFLKTEANISHSFYFEHKKFQYFHDPLLCHPKIVIMYVIQGIACHTLLSYRRNVV